MARVTIRYWAAAREAAGVSEEVLEAATVAGLLAAVRAARPVPSFERVLSRSSFLVSGRPVGTRDHAAVPLVEGDTVEVLPPFAGG